jgi:uncharacterized protein YkwD
MNLKPRAWLLGLLSVLTMTAGGSAPAQTLTNYSHGEPTALEQLMLEYLNRARMNPAQEGALLNALDTPYSRDARSRKPQFFTNLVAEFAAYPAVPPLAFHPKLLQTAGAHSQDMIDRNYFSHLTPEGLAPSDRATALGYTAGVGENLDGGGASSATEVLESHFGLMVDYDNVGHDTAPYGHRLNVLGADYREVGLGIRGPRYGGRVTQDFGNPARAFLLGVAFVDTNADGAYTPGEGLAGVTVTPGQGNYKATTSTSGGYAFPIEALQTITEDVPVPLAIGSNSWSVVEPYDAAYRQQQMQTAAVMTVKLTWSGGPLAAKRVTYLTMKRPVLRNYRLVGTNNWYYSRSLLTAESVKADLVGNAECGAAGWLLDDIYGCLWEAGNGWYWSDCLGWMWFTGDWVFSTSLQQWLGQMGASRTLWSPQFRWFTRSATDRCRAETSAIGTIYVGKYQGAAIPDSWVVSERFGYVWANGDGTWFYSERYGWLGVTPEGGIWSVDQNRFL